MKNYRMLVPVILAVLLVLSWYMLFSNSSKVDDAYQAELAAARDQVNKGVVSEAKKHFINALKIKKTPEVYAECAAFLKDRNTKENRAKDWVTWCESFQDEYPKDPTAIDCLLDAYYSTKDYESCFDTISVAKKRNISTDFIKEIEEKLKYEYTLDYNVFNDVSIFSNNLCAVQKKEKWGFVNRFGDQRIPCKYEEVGVYTSSSYAPVVRDGEAYFIDKSGTKILASAEVYTRYGNLVNNLIPAQKPNGRYVYLNSNMEVAFGDYEYATTFSGGIAAVKNKNAWTFIDTKGNQVFSASYAAVILDEKEIAFRSERAFVSKDGANYIMINAKGEQIGSLTFEDARVFVSADPTAVKIAGKWCFVNTDGKRISEKVYEDARSFSNELAAVCVDEKWGFVDASETLVIPAIFNDARDFNEKGSCFVKNGEQWQLLKLYRLNRE